MTTPRLLLVTDAHRTIRPLPDLLAEAVAGGVDAIYLRHLSAGEDWDAEVDQLRARVGPDIPMMLPGTRHRPAPNAGVHLRERDSLPAFGGQSSPGIVSRSVHVPAEAARSHGVDYLVCGHVYPSASKLGRTPLGLDGLADVVAAAPCPVVAIGGITRARAPAVIAAGAQGVAVIGAISEAPDPRGAARGLRAAVDAALARYTKGLDMERTPAATAITISVNGKPREVPAGSTVHDLLASRKLADSMAIVERNGVILSRDCYASTMLAAGDQLEVVHAVGGG